MTHEFDEMSVRALGLANEELRHIAETEQLTDSENERITAMVLDRMNLTPKQPAVTVRHSKKRRLRIAGALIAAVLTVGALGLGVSGWLTYNKPLMQSYFGSVGDKHFAELALSEPQTFTNGIVNATVEASLRDNNMMMVLITFESADPEKPIYWTKLMNQRSERSDMQETPYAPLFIYNWALLDENGEALGTMDNPYTDISVAGCGVVSRTDNDKTRTSVEYEINIHNLDFDAESISMRFSSAEQGILDVTVPVMPRLKSAVFENDAGKQITVSPVRFRTSVAQLILPQDDSWHNMILNRMDGTQTACYLPTLSTVASSGEDGKWSYNESMIHEITEGMEFEYDNPDSYNSFLEISDIASIEWCGETYVRVPE